MKKSILTAICAFTFSAIAFASLLTGISGVWSCKLKLGDGSTIPLTYHFKQDDNKLSGSVDSPQGELVIEGGRISNDSVSFNVNIQGYDFPHTGKIYPDSIALDVISHGSMLRTTLVRQAAR